MFFILGKLKGEFDLLLNLIIGDIKRLCIAWLNLSMYRGFEGTFD